MPSKGRLAAFLLFSILHTSLAQRGVHPANAERYSSQTFLCDDGLEIPSSAVNDGVWPFLAFSVHFLSDFCDCKSGDDEPGTSACAGRPAAKFYCANKVWTSCASSVSEFSNRATSLCTCPQQELGTLCVIVVMALMRKKAFAVTLAGTMRKRRSLERNLLLTSTVRCVDSKVPISP